MELVLDDLPALSRSSAVGAGVVLALDRSIYFGRIEMYGKISRTNLLELRDYYSHSALQRIGKIMGHANGVKSVCVNGLTSFML